MLPDSFAVTGLTGTFDRIYTEEKSTALYRNVLSDQVCTIRCIQNANSKRVRQVIRFTSEMNPHTDGSPGDSMTTTITVDRPAKTSVFTPTVGQTVLGWATDPANGDIGLRLLKGQL